MDLTATDYDLLESLRARFLRAETEKSPYWQSSFELELYDKTLARRIFWKISAVCEGLSAKNWAPGPTLIDWGCGSGAMSECFLEFFPNIECLHLFDHSELAISFAKDKLQKLYPKLEIHTHLKAATLPFGHTCVGSHMLGELEDNKLQGLLQFLENSSAFVFVEAGTPQHSLKLIRLREALRRHFHIVGPCPHEQRCQILAQDQHWCHNFAKAPSEVFQDKSWAEISKRLKIDLRTLPYSFLAMDKEKKLPLKKSHHLGRARVYKGFAKALWCQAGGELQELEHSKSKEKVLFKALKKNPNLTE